MPKTRSLENVTKPEAPPPSPFDQGERLLNVKQVPGVIVRRREKCSNTSPDFFVFQKDYSEWLTSVSRCHHMSSIVINRAA